MSATMRTCNDQRRGLGLIAPVRMERLESVADAEDGLEIFPAVGAEFCAQPPNVDIQCPRSDLIAVAPDAHEQHFARYDLACVFYQQRKQFVFLASQHQSMGIQRGQAAAEVQFQMRILVAGCFVRCNLYRIHVVVQPFHSILRSGAFGIVVKP